MSVSASRDHPRSSSNYEPLSVTGGGIYLDDKNNQEDDMGWGRTRRRCSLPTWMYNFVQHFVERAQFIATVRLPAWLTIVLIIASAALFIRMRAVSKSQGTPSRFGNIPISRYYPDNFLDHSLVVLRPPLPPVNESDVKGIRTASCTHSPGWNLTDHPSHLSACKKIGVFQFGTGGGFGSAFNHMLQAAFVAESLGLPILIDTGRSLYGAWENYFEPIPISCVPPEDWYSEEKCKNIGQEGWETADRICLGSGSDAYVIDHSMRPFKDDIETFYNHVNSRPARYVLPADETLPSGFVPSFKVFSEISQRIWKPVAAILEDLEATKALMGTRKGFPAVGIHVRLGDKLWETTGMLQVANLNNTFGNLTAHLSAAHEELEGLLVRNELRSQTSMEPFDTSVRPRCFLVTTEEGILYKLADDHLAPPFQFEQTPVHSLPNRGFDQYRFYESPLALKVAHTRQLVRDITLLANEFDVSIVSGSSNIGRLVMTLAGPESVVEPKKGRHDGKTRSIRSTDMWWFPCRHSRDVLSTIGVECQTCHD